MISEIKGKTEFFCTLADALFSTEPDQIGALLSR